MKKLSKEEIETILDSHKVWLESNGKEGESADLRDTDLRDTDLRGSDLSNVDLIEAVFIGANLREALFIGSDLSNANLSYSDLRGADLRGADLRCADLDYSCLPLWCGSLNMKIDDSLFVQLLYHTLAVCPNQEKYKFLFSDEILETVNKFHRVEGCGKITKE